MIASAANWPIPMTDCRSSAAPFTTSGDPELMKMLIKPKLVGNVGSAIIPGRFVGIFTTTSYIKREPQTVKDFERVAKAEAKRQRKAAR